MPFVMNFPFFSIMLPILSGVLCLTLKGKHAARLFLAVNLTVLALSCGALGYTANLGESFPYQMGHFPAPFGNELRAGPLEALMAVVFSAVMLLSVAGGAEDIKGDIPEKKHNLFYVMLCLVFSAMLSILYTNDIFTGYVFIDMLTIGACSIITVKPGGKTLIATISYLVMSLIGSCMILLSISLLYGVTGHLLLPNIGAGVTALMASGEYNMPLFVIIALMVVGLGIKSALYPFHVWLPNAHASATTASSSILSGLIVKVYLIFLAKLFCRAFGLEAVAVLHITDLILAFGILGLVMGSLRAVKQRNIKRMLSYSSIAQVGYICIGLGLNNPAGLAAACFHMVAHATAKPMLFTAAAGLSAVSGRSKDFNALRGSARRDPLSGAAFVMGALSMVGIPLFPGFVSKLILAGASRDTPFHPVVVIAALVLTTLLNAVYYLPAVVCIFAKRPEGEEGLTAPAHPPSYYVSLVCFLAICLGLGIAYQPVLAVIEAGISVLG